MTPNANVDITDVILNVLADVPQDVREGFFALLRERWCIYCGADTPTYKCYCRATGEDV